MLVDTENAYAESYECEEINSTQDSNIYCSRIKLTNRIHSVKGREKDFRAIPLEIK